MKAERKLAAATARVGVARAEQLPTVTISGTVGGQQFRAGSLTIGGFGTWSIGDTITVPIFDAGKKRFQTEGKIAQPDEAADAYRAKVLSALEEAETPFPPTRRIAESVTPCRAPSPTTRTRCASPRSFIRRA